MGRWLESDHIAMQMEDAEREAFFRETPTPGVSFAAVERAESLRLSMERVRGQLARATNPNYRRMLERALADLIAQL